MESPLELSEGVRPTVAGALTLGFWPPEPGEKKCLCYATELVVICHSNHKKLIQTPKLCPVGSPRDGSKEGLGGKPRRRGQ